LQADFLCGERTALGLIGGGGVGFALQLGAVHIFIGELQQCVGIGDPAIRSSPPA
jgi:hypothetical protein